MSETEARQVIPDAAVEAAAEKLAGGPIRLSRDREPYVRWAREILETAAPHMLARAWNEGHDYRRGITPDGLTGNPYMPTRMNSDEMGDGNE